MRKSAVLLSLAAAVSMFAGLPRNIWADSAEVLPKGVKKVGLSSDFYLPVQDRYNEEGDKEPLATDFNEVLDSGIFVELSAIESAFGMPSGSAAIGTSVVDFEYSFTEVTFDFQYGLTDKLTVGLSAPYRFFKNKVSASVDTTNATIGVNPAYGTPADKFGVPVIPVAAGGVQSDAAATEFVQQTLVEGYGYDRLESVSQQGFLDISLGGRYQYLKNENWRLAVTGGVKVPTGKVDDPDNLADFGFGSGTWMPFVHLNQDYVGIKNLVLNGTFRYELLLPHKETLRVLLSPDQPISANKEEVDLDLGDIIELEFSGAYELRRDLTASALYRYVHSMKDKVSGNLGYNYAALEEDTDSTEHIGILELSYSTLPLFQDKKFPVPLEAGISYRNRFAGKNNVNASQYIGLTLGIYF